MIIYIKTERLYIQEGLQRLGLASLNIYYSDDRWLAIRGLSKRTKPYLCAGCNEKNKKILHLHHKTYENLGLPSEISDLVWLCKRCHREIHLSSLDNLYENTNKLIKLGKKIEEASAKEPKKTKKRKKIEAKSKKIKKSKHIITKKQTRRLNRKRKYASKYDALPIGIIKVKKN